MGNFKIGGLDPNKINTTTENFIKNNELFVSEKYFRPAEVEELLGDSTKARNQLGWVPEYTFDTLLEEMVEEDCK